jgi:hypothetical protein
MAKVGKPVKHPASKFWALALIFLILALVFCIFACFFPAWSRYKGSGIPTSELGSYVSTAVTSDSRLYLGHWMWCLQYEDPLDTKTCANNADSTGPPAYGNSKCKGFWWASRICGLVGIGFLFLALLIVFMVTKSLKAWKPHEPWKAPMGAAAIACLLTVLAAGLCIASWACWIVIAEESCSNTLTVWNPFQGYSYSFIVMCFASGWALIAALLMCLGLMKLKKTPKAVAEVLDDEVTFEVVPTPAAAPLYPEYVSEYPGPAPSAYPPQYPTYPAPTTSYVGGPRSAYPSPTTSYESYPAYGGNKGYPTTNTYY